MAKRVWQDKGVGNRGFGLPAECTRFSLRVMRPTLLALALLIACIEARAAGRETLSVPAVSVELTFGGEGKATVDGKVTKLTGEQATKLRADLAALKYETLSRELAKLRDLETAAEKAKREAATRAQAVEREQDRVADQQKQIAALEKRQKDAQDELNGAQHANYNVNIDNLRSRLNAINSSLTSERKDLARARERLELAEKRKKENETALNAAVSEAAGLRKALTERVEKLRAVLKTAGLGAP